MAIDTIAEKQRWLGAIRAIFNNEPYSMEAATTAFSHVSNLNGRVSYDKKNNLIAITIPNNQKIKPEMTALLQEINAHSNSPVATFNESSQSWEIQLAKDFLQQNKLIACNIMMLLCQDTSKAALINDEYRNATKLIETERKNVSTGLAIACTACTLGVITALAITGAFVPVLVLAALAVVAGGTAWTVAKHDPDGKLASKINRSSSKFLRGIRSILPISTTKNTTSLHNTNEIKNTTETTTTQQTFEQPTESTGADYVAKPSSLHAAQDSNDLHEDPSLKPFLDSEGHALSRSKNKSEQISHVIPQESMVSMDTVKKTVHKSRNENQ